MATFVWDNAYFAIQKGSSSAVDLSDHVTEATLTVTPEILDETAHGDSWRTRKAGLKDWNATVTVHQDFAASKTDSVIYSYMTSAQYSSTITIYLRESKSASVAATNPSYNGPVLIESFTPFSGTVGELATATISMQGNGAITRDTS